jgi:3-phenylpropionate/trans-cinnamate dioxygenase ferredoxin subunit
MHTHKEEVAMADFVEVAQLDQIAPGNSKMVYVEEKSIALFNVDGMIYAIDDSCLHQGSSLAQGKLNGKIVTCRGHGWKYDVTTGSLTLNPESSVASYSVKIIDGKIMVDTSKKA